ncbi:MAG TPA: trypsin-like peptidase domain-containing protein [Acidimicrobiales bacterium]|nr:trypsin-like peptidase domain-containing protein [Acidimicrobiales bacterium]
MAAAPSRRRRRTTTALVASGAAAAVAAGALLLAATSSGGPGTTTSSTPPTALSVVTGCCRVLPTLERDARNAMVSLHISAASGVSQGCGVVVAAGGLVLTTFDAVAHARSLTAVTANGTHLSASVVGTDQESDVALVRVPADLPVARFAGDTGTATGRRATAMAAATNATGHGDQSSLTMWTTGTVRSVDTTVVRGSAVGMAGIEATTGPRPAIAGEALLDGNGRVLGILDSSDTVDGENKVFLPAQLVVGVANSLAVSGRVDHGWLGIQGGDAPTSAITTTTSVTDIPVTPTREADAGERWPGGGALVEAVEPNGASAGLLRPGEVIHSIDGQPVRTMGQLRNRLYVLPPGTRVVLGVSDRETTTSVAVDLAGSP